MPGLGLGLGLWKRGGRKFNPLIRLDLVAAYLGEDVPDGAVASVVRRVGTANMAVTGTASAAGGIITQAGDGTAEAAFAFSVATTGGTTRYALMRPTAAWGAADRCLFDGATTQRAMIDFSTAILLRCYLTGGGSIVGAATWSTDWRVYWSGCAAANVAGTYVGYDSTEIANGTLTGTANHAGLAVGGTGGGTENPACQWAMALAFNTLHDAATRTRVIAWMRARAAAIYGIVWSAGFFWAANQWAENLWAVNQWL